VIPLADVFEALTGSRPQKAEFNLKKAAVYSRQIQAGDLFAALQRGAVDGHAFIGDAFHRGARTALVQQDQSHLFPEIDLRSGTLPESLVLPKVPFCIRVEDTRLALQKIAGFWRRKLNPRVIGVAVRPGDCITRQLTVEMLEMRFSTLIPDLDGDPETGLSLELINLKNAAQVVLLELQLDEPALMRSLCQIAAPHVGMIGYVACHTADHTTAGVDFSHSQAEFFKLLPPAPQGFAILSYDNLCERQIASEIQAQTFFYGINPQADLWADEIESHGQEGIRFRIHFCHESLMLRVPVLGHYSVHAVLESAAVGLVEGLSWQEIATGLHMGHSELLLMVAHASNGALILDDTYSVSAESTLKALNLLEKMDGRKIAVLGEIPAYGPYGDAHERVAVRAAGIVNELVAVGEQAQPVARSAARAGIRSVKVTWVRTPGEAVEYLQKAIRPDDILLVKGSHEVLMDRIVNGLEGIIA